MRYRQLVTVQRPVEGRTAAGGVVPEYSNVDGLVDLPATIVPSRSETRGPDFVAIEDRYEIIVARRHDGIETTDAVVDRDGRRFNIETIDLSLGERQTRISARIVRFPSSAEEGS